METDRNYAGIARKLEKSDGQAVQHFMSNSPWQKQRVYVQIQSEIKATPELMEGSFLVLDESADERAGLSSAGAYRQYNGRFGKVDVCIVAVVLGYINWKSGPWPIWSMVDSELFLPEEWFVPDFAAARQKLEVPPDRQFETKPQLGLKMILRAKTLGLPFEGVACDDLYGRSPEFRAGLDDEEILYVADVPADTRVYLARPEIGVPKKPPGKKGPKNTRLRVLNGVKPVTAEELGRDPSTQWHRLRIRPNERGVLEDDFAARLVWTWNKDQPEPRQEWLVMRVERNGVRTYALSNAPADTSLQKLAELNCSRYFVERVIQDAKEECGWDEFQARKYPGWEHHTALTACALWFVAQTKMKWAAQYARDPHLLHQLEVQALPALSTANVRELLRSVLPLPQLSPEEAVDQVAKHLVNRSRSTASRLRRRRRYRSKSRVPT
jgi:SRSO17 transposase